MNLPDPVHIELPDARGYAVQFAPLATLPEHLGRVGLATGPCLVVTDSNVARLHLGALTLALENAGWRPRARVLPAGESTKSVRDLSSIYDWALRPPAGEQPVDRSTPLLALGGGVIGDLAGFAAATLLRGLPLVHLPTTLLAMVDSAIGGKTGINHAAGKNLIGAIHQPRLVLADLEILNSLPDREWTSGLAEVVKAGLIADATFIDWLEEHWDALIARQPGPAGEMVRRAVAIKAAVVAEDEREQARRAILNFGHTFAHAIERVTGYAHFTHGEAVTLGMRAATYLSFRLDPSIPLPRIDALLARLPVPPGMADLNVDDLADAMLQDKKRTSAGIRFVVLEALGDARLAADVDPALVQAAWAFVRGAARSGARS